LSDIARLRIERIARESSTTSAFIPISEVMSEPPPKGPAFGWRNASLIG